MLASSTTTTARSGRPSSPPARRSCSSAARLVDSIAAPSSSSRAARRATAAPNHDVALGLPGLARGVERERLTGAGLAGDDLHAVPVAREATHHPGLLFAER